MFLLGNSLLLVLNLLELDRGYDAQQKHYTAEMQLSAFVGIFVSANSLEVFNVWVIWLVAAIGDDNFYSGVSGSPAYDSVQTQQPANTLTAEEQAAREQAWRAELAKVSKVLTYFFWS